VVARGPLELSLDPIIYCTVLLHSLLSHLPGLWVFKFPSHCNVDLSLRALVAENIFYSHSFGISAPATVYADGSLS
jgi:hypothetical protein